jgi:23S rRNA (pseudouridine1915-N3)-methyltransferase
VTLKITVVAVGRAKAGPARDLHELYGGRLSQRYFGHVSLTEVEERRNLAPEVLKVREAERLLAAVPAGSIIVALDETGRTLSTADFAKWLAGRRDGGVQDLAFLIGGAEGLAKEIVQKADLVLSLGPMTWPHLLVRGLLMEQLYRAQCIWSGHPYHRG